MAWACGLTAAFAGATLAGLLALAPARAASPVVPCGGASPAARDAIDNRAVHTIYAGELASPEVTADLAHVTGAADLVRAVADDDGAAVLAATTRIVYTPRWHIVRLRVLSSSGRVLADVGGPDILAPVAGTLISDGTVIGSFVMSVQDDRGYKKLVTRLVGLPIELYEKGKPLMGTVEDPPSPPPLGGTLTRGGVRYEVDSFNLEAFPSGVLRAVVLIPAPTAALRLESCAMLRLATISGIVTNVARQFGPYDEFQFAEHQGLFVADAYPLVGSPIFVLDGSTEVAGTNELPGSVAPAPPTLPDHGAVTYESRQWQVYSFELYPPDRIYVLASR